MEHAPHEGETSVIVSLSDAAMHMYTAAIDALPFPEDKKFHKRADVVLSGMRKLRAGLAEGASRSRSTPMVIVALADVRKRYDDLMARAAAAPGSSLGQQLYAARVEAKLSAQEVANGAGLSVDLINDLEAGEIPTEKEAEKVRALIDALGGVPGTEHLTPPPPGPEPVAAESSAEPNGEHTDGEHTDGEHNDGEHNDGEQHHDEHVHWESFVGGN
jgi:transcriptional regulator with XRE-family HTH domain